jgi:hypothetical protein
LIEYVHPAFMAVTLGLVFFALRHGLTLRRARSGGDLGALSRKEHRERHLRFGKLAIVCVTVGFVGGAATTTFVLDQQPITTLHGLLGALSLLSFGVVARFGDRLEHGDASAREAHAWAAFAAVLCAGTGAVAGFALLP